MSQSLNTNQGNPDSLILGFDGKVDPEKSRSLNTDQGNRTYPRMNGTQAAQVESQSLNTDRGISGPNEKTWDPAAVNLSQSLSTNVPIRAFLQQGGGKARTSVPIRSQFLNTNQGNSD